MPMETPGQNLPQTQDNVASANDNKGQPSTSSSSSSSQTTSSRNLKIWFEEFRAKVSKKSQSTTNQSTGSEISASSQAPTNQGSEENSNKTSTKDNQTQQANNKGNQKETVATKTAAKTAGLRSRKKAGKLQSPSVSVDRSEPKEVQQTSSNTTTTTTTTTSERINAGNRSGASCRYESLQPSTAKKRRSTGGVSSILTALLTPLNWIIYYLLPFNYNLPWKLICLILASFVIVVIGLASGSTDASRVFSFANGFVCGLATAGAGFIILTLSFIVHILPKTKDKNHSLAGFGQKYKSSEFLEGDSILTSPPGQSALLSKISRDSQDTSPLDYTDLQREDFSLIEVLEDEDGEDDEESDDEGSDADQQQPEHPARLSPIKLRKKLADDDYKGWMIEFIGDYELRNTSDIKLKSIFVKIVNRVLYLCKTKNNHDHHADSATPLVFISQRVYDLNCVKKFSANLLLPKNVRNKQKYVWSKKYPIKLEFQIVDVAGGGGGGPEQATTSTTSETNKTIGDNVRQIQLTLFARSCREKEEWFRRFKRIVEANRLGLGQSTVRSSLKSEDEGEAESSVSESLGESLLSSFKRFRCRSPSPKRDFVQTSQSSHLLSEPKRMSDDEAGRTSSELSAREPATAGTNTSGGLARTKSCELLHPIQNQASLPVSSTGNRQDKTNEDDNISSSLGPADDSTLTRETADLFSQAIDYSKFLESQPTLDYKEYIERIIRDGRGATPTSDWFNALTSRIFFDVFSHNYWSSWFKRKIQRKLYRIRLPHFMETLTLTQIDLGTNAPQFLNVVSHTFDALGLSIDFEMAYSGGLTMTFETKLNLLKIKPENSSASNATSGGDSAANTAAAGGADPPQQQQLQDSSLDSSLMRDGSSSAAAGESSCENLNARAGEIGNKPSLSLSASSARTSCESTSDSEDTDSDSSSDSSFDEADLNEISDWEDYGAEKTRQNIVKFVDKIASSRYFQSATENRYIKKKLKDISNCPLVLVVQIQSLTGVLTLNVPPPQTDRLWYGFKPMPELTLKAIPRMGDREFSLSHVTDWIERKLAEEFRKILVMPNMEDIVLPVLKSDYMQYITATR